MDTYKSDELVERLQQIDFARAMIEQLVGGGIIRLPTKQVSECIDALLRGVPYIGYAMPKAIQLYRGRVVDQSERLVNSEEFSYLPAEKQQKYGRCNFPLETVFYSSTSLDTVLSELRPKVGDKVFVGVAEPRHNKTLLCSAISEFDQFRRTESGILGGRNITSYYNDWVISAPNGLRTLLVDAFFSSLFRAPVSDEAEYKGTAILSKLLFNAGTEDKNIDGFAYPSVAHRGGLNFAIEPNSFDKKCKWSHFMEFEITDYFGFDIYGRRQVSKSSLTDNEGCIVWESVVDGV